MLGTRLLQLNRLRLPQLILAATFVTEIAVGMATKDFQLRVVTYNVLSSQLAKPSSYPNYNPDHLKESNRFPVVLDKLKSEIDNNKDGNVVICLQEVSYDWAGKLHTFFANNNYHLVTGLYGKYFNGYMGVALAYPTATMETVSVNIARLSEEREWPKSPPPGIADKVWSSFMDYAKGPLQKAGLYNPDDYIDHWKMSQSRFNVILAATLRVSDKTFVIGTYHMPCAYYAPKVMTIHADMSLKFVQKIANGNPCILAGDFNIKPQEPVYKLLTTGHIDASSAFFPTPKADVEWKATSKPMKSAYAVANGSEPGYTNYAQMGDKEEFIDTLDYIFVSDEWKVTNTKSLPKLEEKKGPLPNLDHDEPSDHLLLAATLQL